MMLWHLSNGSVAFINYHIAEVELCAQETQGTGTTLEQDAPAFAQMPSFA
jgi:hypothetical protein